MNLFLFLGKEKSHVIAFRRRSPAMTIRTANVAFFDFRFNFLPTAVVCNHFSDSANFSTLSRRSNSRTIGSDSPQSRHGFFLKVFQNLQHFFLTFVFSKKRVVFRINMYDWRNNDSYYEFACRDETTADVCFLRAGERRTVTGFSVPHFVQVFVSASII